MPTFTCNEPTPLSAVALAHNKVAIVSTRPMIVQRAHADIDLHIGIALVAFNEQLCMAVDQR